jgi:alkylated DNA repair dioxygenase AlkB
MEAVQLSLLEPTAARPQGFVYRPALISAEEEAELAARVGELEFRAFEFHGYFGRRRVVSYGLRYDFADSKVHRAEEIPALLLPLRDRAAVFAGIVPSKLEHALVSEYMPGAAIGWHKDRPVFGDVVGISLLSACRMRFRRALPGRRWERTATTLEPRSGYLFRGPVRSEWEHSIPPAEQLRYSVTFRTVTAR